MGQFFLAALYLMKPPNHLTHAFLNLESFMMKDIIRKIIRAAHLAPTADNSQPFFF